MSKIINLLRNEPALVVGVVVAVLTLLVAFGVHLSDGQNTAIQGLITALLALIGAGAIRAQVTPVGKPGEDSEPHTDQSRTDGQD